MEEPTAAPRCARHPEMMAVIACVRCGDFACAACRVDALCKTCDARFGGYRIPWEEGASYRSWFSTLRLSFTDARAFFSRMPDGKVGPALLFTGLLGAVCTLPEVPMELLAGGMQGEGPRAVGRMIGGPIGAMIGVAIGAALYGWGHYAAAKLLGGEAKATTGIRVAAYSMALLQLTNLIGTLAPLSDAILIGAGVLQLGASGFMVVAFYLFGRGRHGLSVGRALVAAVAPTFLVFTLACCAVAAYTLVTFDPNAPV